jgi:NAD(P)-dependent dehydrogenase (short-subunit alcohol dehydrogenase family)
VVGAVTGSWSLAGKVAVVTGAATGGIGEAYAHALADAGSPFMELMKQRAALRPFGQPDELCGALLLLTAPAGDWITGQVLNVRWRRDPAHVRGGTTCGSSARPRSIR